jgi:hypothetical protein
MLPLYVCQIISILWQWSYTQTIWYKSKSTADLQQVIKEQYQHTCLLLTYNRLSRSSTNTLAYCWLTTGYQGAVPTHLLIAVLQQVIKEQYQHTSLLLTYNRSSRSSTNTLAYCWLTTGYQGAVPTHFLTADLQQVIKEQYQHTCTWWAGVNFNLNDNVQIQKNVLLISVLFIWFLHHNWSVCNSNKEIVI